MAWDVTNRCERGTRYLRPPASARRWRADVGRDGGRRGLRASGFSAGHGRNTRAGLGVHLSARLPQFSTGRAWSWIFASAGRRRRSSAGL